MILSNAKILTRDTWIRRGWVEVVNDKIVGVGSEEQSGDIDCDGGYLFPGLIDLHNCSLKTLMLPRPGRPMPVELAHKSHEILCLRHGITTVFHTVRVSDLAVTTETNFSEFEREGIDLLGLTRSNVGPRQFVHLRCDLAWHRVVKTAERAIASLAPTVVSFIRCCPGVGRFCTLAVFEEYVRNKVDANIVSRRSPTEQEIWERAAQIIRTEATHRKLYCLHDPSTRQDIEHASGLGIGVAEFPVSQDAVEGARQHGLAICMGAPNVLSGASQYGNLSATDVWEQGNLDLLTSDYYIPSLLAGIFRLARTNEGIDDEILARALRLGTHVPGNLLRCSQHRSVEPGMNADLVLAEVNEGFEPDVRLAMVSGEVRYSRMYH